MTCIISGGPFVSGGKPKHLNKLIVLFAKLEAKATKLAKDSLTGYRRDWLIGACAYRLQQQENMRLLYVCAY